MIKTILIKPDLTTEESIDQYAYQAFSEIRQKDRTEEQPLNEELPNGTWLHTIPTKEGLFITIHRTI